MRDLRSLHAGLGQGLACGLHGQRSRVAFPQSHARGRAGPAVLRIMRIEGRFIRGIGPGAPTPLDAAALGEACGEADGHGSGGDALRDLDPLRAFKAPVGRCTCDGAQRGIHGCACGMGSAAPKAFAMRSLRLGIDRMVRNPRFTKAGWRSSQPVTRQRQRAARSKACPA